MAIEDTGSVDAQNNEIYIIANPGEGPDRSRCSIPACNLPKPKRDYDSVEFALEKRFANNWYLRSSYLWSRLYGNYSGLSQSDENGRTSPNVGRLYDYPIMMFQDGGQASYGPLPTDRPHQFKTQFIYQFGFGTSVGLNEYVASGLPVSREIGMLPPNNFPVQYLGRGSDGRTPTYLADRPAGSALVPHRRIAGAPGQHERPEPVQPGHRDLEELHLPEYTGGVTVNEAAVLRGYADDRIADRCAGHRPEILRFLMDNAFQAPIQARFGVKFVF